MEVVLDGSLKKLDMVALCINKAVEERERRANFGVTCLAIMISRLSTLFFIY